MAIHQDYPRMASSLAEEKSYGERSVSGTLQPELGLFKLGLGSTSKNGDSSSLSRTKAKQYVF